VVHSCTVRKSSLSKYNRKASRTVENASAVNFALSEAEVKEISDVVDKHGVVGGGTSTRPPRSSTSGDDCNKQIFGASHDAFVQYIYVSKKRREDGMAEGEPVGGWGEDKR
jgi:hypothetical protein